VGDLIDGSSIVRTQFCKVCSGKIVMTIFKNTGVCCELCRKVDAGEITKEQAHVQRVQ
jgi:hypothetical protein